MNAETPEDREPAGRTAARRWLLAGLAAVALALLIALGYGLADLYRATRPRPPVASTAGPTTRPATQPTSPLAPLLGPGPATRPSETALLGQGYEPLDRNPAGLAPPPGGELQGRFQRRDPGWVQRVALWRVPGASPDELARYYREQAAKRGFAPIGRAGEAGDEPGGGRTLLFRPTNAQAAERILTIRLMPRDGKIHVTVWLRYAETRRPPRQPAPPRGRE